MLRFVGLWLQCASRVELSRNAGGGSFMRVIGTRCIVACVLYVVLIGSKVSRSNRRWPQHFDPLLLVYLNEARRVLLLLNRQPLFIPSLFLSIGTLGALVSDRPCFTSYITWVFWGICCERCVSVSSGTVRVHG